MWDTEATRNMVLAPVLTGSYLPGHGGEDHTNTTPQIWENWWGNGILDETDLELRLPSPSTLTALTTTSWILLMGWPDPREPHHLPSSLGATLSYLSHVTQVGSLNSRTEGTLFKIMELESSLEKSSDSPDGEVHIDLEWMLIYCFTLWLNFHAVCMPFRIEIELHFTVGFCYNLGDNSSSSEIALQSAPLFPTSVYVTCGHSVP